MHRVLVQVSYVLVEVCVCLVAGRVACVGRRRALDHFRVLGARVVTFVSGTGDASSHFVIVYGETLWRAIRNALNVWFLLGRSVHGRARAIRTVEPGWERVLLLPLTSQFYIIILSSHLLCHHL